MPKYQIQAVGQNISQTMLFETKSIKNAEEEAKKLSTENKDVGFVIISSKAFIRYDNGEITETSKEPLADEPIE